MPKAAADIGGAVLWPPDDSVIERRDALATPSTSANGWATRIYRRSTLRRDGLVSVDTGAAMRFLQLDDFAGRLNETFTAEIEQTRTLFVLVEARPLQSGAVPRATRAPFSLLFRNQSPVLFPQRTYSMTNATVGSFAIFLVPVARDRDGYLYKAIFN